MESREHTLARPRPPLSASNSEHIAWIEWARRNGGGQCGTCGQRAQDYGRTITKPMAHALLTFYQYGGTDRWVKRTKVLRKLGQRGGDDSKLELWGLIETPESGEQMTDGKKTGWARVTPLGRDFILGLATVRKKAWVFNSELLELEGEPVTFQEALGRDFDLGELLNTRHDR